MVLRGLVRGVSRSQLVWLLACVFESLGYLLTLTITILSASCWDTGTSSIELPAASRQSQYLFLSVSGLVILGLLCLRLALWKWIAFTEMRLWRLGPTMLLSEALWATAVIITTTSSVIRGSCAVICNIEVRLCHSSNILWLTSVRAGITYTWCHEAFTFTSGCGTPDSFL